MDAESFINALLSRSRELATRSTRYEGPYSIADFSAPSGVRVRGPILTETPTTTLGQTPTTVDDPIDQSRAAVDESLQSLNQENLQRKISIEEIRRAIAEKRPIKLGANDVVEGGNFSRGGRTAVPSSEEAIAKLDLRDRIDVLRRRASDGFNRDDGADTAYREVLSKELPYLAALAQVSGDREVAESRMAQAASDGMRLRQEADESKYDKVLASFAANREKFRKALIENPQMLNVPRKVRNAEGKEITLARPERKTAELKAAERRALEMALLGVPERYRRRILEDSGIGLE